MTQRRPFILAHRGARKYAPENTMPAFKKAIELGLDGVEFDVMSTSDGVPIVGHDDNLAKLSGISIDVHKTPYVDLQNIDVGGRFNPYYSGEKMPTLKEVLELFSGTGLLLNIELKTQPRQHRNFIRHVAETIEKFTPPFPPLLKGGLLVSSFSPRLLSQFGKIAPGIKRSLLIRPRAFYFLRARFFVNMLQLDGINPHISILSESMKRYTEKRGLKLITWTANTPEQIRKAAEIGVDGIITDEPVLAREIINRSSTL